MEENNIKAERQTEFEVALSEILNQNIDSQSQGKEVEGMSAKTTQFDKTNNLLLKYYNEKNQNDFEKELKATLTVGAYKKIKKKLDGVNKEEQEEQIRDISKEALAGEQVDQDIEERAIKKVKEEIEAGEEVDIKAEVMKAVYEEAFEKYATLLEKYKMAQLREESLTVGDKEGTELVLYEKYLLNLERSYSNYASKKGLEVKSLFDDPQIKAKKEKLEYEMKKITRSNDMAVSDNLQRIKVLSDRRNYLAEEMSKLAQNRKNMSPEQFRQSMDYYQQQYFEVTIDIRAQDPTLEEYRAQIEQENENIEYSDREIGVRSDNIIAGNYVEKDEIGSDVLGEENIEEIEEIDEEYAESSKDAVEDLVKEAKEALQYGDLKRAEEVIESAESIAFGRALSHRESSEEEPKETEEQIKDDLEENYEESSNPFMKQMESGVASEKEARLQERLRLVEEELVKDDIQTQREQTQEQVYIRTRTNKKW